MFNFNCHFILILTVVYTAIAADDQTCDVNDKSAKALCKLIAKTFPQDDGKFSKYACDCLTAFMTKQPELCDTKDYDFAGVPKCADLFKSKEFEEQSSKDNLFADYLIDVQFKKEYKVCTESEDKVVDAASVIYQPGCASDALNFVMRNTFEPKLGKLFSNCYRQALELLTQPED